MEQTQNTSVNPMTLNCDHDLELRSREIGSVHCLTEINIWVKLKGSGHMERTPIEG